MLEARPAVRIAVVTSSPPMAEGGHMVIARELTRALREAGHDAHIIVTPQNRFGRQASAYLATWLTDVTSSEGRPIDQVISLRYPSYAIRHRRHVCWLNHTMREYYDLWDTFSATLSAKGRLKERVRKTFIHAADRYLLTRLSRLFVQSRTVQQRIAIVAVGEFDGPVSAGAAARLPVRRLRRRVLLRLAPDAAEARGPARARAGDARGQRRSPGDCGRGGRAGGARAARRASSASPIGSRSAGRLTDDQLIAELATCRAVCFPPFQEDYGFVTVEAFAARKAVITCRDSGGPAELVKDGVNGFVCEPTPDAIGRAMRRLADDPALAERMGTAAFEAGSKLTWPETVRQLVLQ